MYAPSAALVISYCLFEQVRLLAGDEIPERLELEPSRRLGSDLMPRCLSARGIDLHGRTGSFGQQLGMAAPIHRYEPPGGLIHCVPYGEQAVVAQDDRLSVP